MPNRTIRVESLHGGISQQPDHLRHPHQVKDAENAAFSVVDGVSKRPGSIFIAEVTGLAAEGNYRIHAIHRDAAEKYLVIYGEGDLVIFETDGLEANITVDAAAQTYLDLNTPNADQLRLVSVADYTFIVNTTVPLAASASTSFTVTATHDTFADMIATTPADNTYHKVTETGRYYQYDAGDGTYATAKMYSSTNWWWGWAPNYAAQTVGATINPGGFNVGFQRLNMDITGGTFTESTKNLLKTGAFTSYTWQAGDQLYITGGTAVTAGWYAIASRTDDDNIVLETTITTDASDPSDVVTDAIGVYAELVIELTAETLVDMHDVAAKFQAALRDGGATNALVAWTSTASSYGYFTITSPFNGSGAAMFDTETPTVVSPVIFDYTDAANNFPPFITETKTAGTGTADSVEPEDRWTLVAPPSQSDALIDATTMPVQLTRTSASSGATPAEFAVDPVTWSDRSSGDTLTNPLPSLWADGETIADIAMHRNRLVLAGGESVVFSQTGDLFNFWIDDATNVVDSDPIDVSLASEMVTDIDYIEPWRKTVVFFTKAGRQFELNTPEALTPASVAIVPSTRYQTQSVRSQPLADVLYFAGQLRDASVLHEYVYDDSRVSNMAADVTAHVQALLPPTLRTIAVCANERTVAVIPTDGVTIYVYRSHWADGKRVQSAWTRWVFDDSYRIADIAAIESNLYMLVESDSQYVIEELPVTRQVTP